VRVGKFARLKSVLAAEACTDEVLVTRCQLLAGAGSAYRVAVQFVRTDLLPEHSIRRVVLGDGIDGEGWRV
jgi:hypothetical protein